MIIIRQVQLTMNRRSLQKSKNEDDPLVALLAISSQYSQLLQQLALNNTQAQQRSTQAYLFETLQGVKQLNSCMKQQLKHYAHFASPSLQNFLEKKRLVNASNLIGKYESLNDEIDTYKARISELENSNSEQEVFQALQEEERALQEEMRRLTSRRIDLRNKNEMIEYQLECGQADLTSLKASNCEEEIKLRKMENILRSKRNNL